MAFDSKPRMLHRCGLTVDGDWIESWCGCGWKYHPPEIDGTRLERLRQAYKRGLDHVKAGQET